MNRKHIISILAVLLFLYCAALIFNHLNAWVGIAVALTVIILAIKTYFNNLKF